MTLSAASGRYLTTFTAAKVYATTFACSVTYTTRFAPARSLRVTVVPDSDTESGARLATDIADVGTFGPYQWIPVGDGWSDDANWIDNETWSDS